MIPGTMEEERYQVMAAPLGELPPEEAVEAFAEEVRWRENLIWPPNSLGKDPTKVLRQLLEEVRGREGIRLRQLTEKSPWPTPGTVSVLTVLGVHGNRSAYIAHYGKAHANRAEEPPYGPFQVLGLVGGEEEVDEQLSFLEEKLLRRYPPLREFPVSAFVEAVEVGQVVFPIDLTGYAPCVLIGETTLPLFKRGHREGLLWPLPWERLARADEEALVRVLRKRTLLGLLPPKTARSLLRGNGDPKEVERVAAMAHLSGF
jgi:hypothetical protein